MEILWLAIIFYSIGLGLVLHFRPSLMFNENGTWKEFGYQRAEGAESRHTLLPFWLFAITWAFVSYVIAAAIVWVIGSQSGSVVAATTATYALYHQDQQQDLEEQEQQEQQQEVIETERRPRGRPPKTKAREGYYVLEPAAEGKGLRRYVYYGSSPPPDAEAV